MAKSSTSYPNQKPNKKPTRAVYRKFLQMIENAETDDTILCFEDACKSIGWRGSRVDYWVRTKPVFKNLKEDIRDVIKRRINKEALKGERNGGFNSTASIWRLKMLGEKETQHVDHTTNNKELGSRQTKEDLKAEIKEIMKDIEDTY